jgi:hypothetical protein
MFTAKRMFGSKLNVPSLGTGTTTLPPVETNEILYGTATTRAMTMAEYEQYTRVFTASKKSEPPYFATGVACGDGGGWGSSGYDTGKIMTATEVMNMQNQYRNLPVLY